MTVEQLIAELNKISDKTLKVVRPQQEDSGCSTCGPYNVEVEVTEVNDLETRIVIA